MKPDGRVFFVDDHARTPEELIYGEASPAIQRRLQDGTAHRAVKVPHEPAELEERLRRLGWHIHVTRSGDPFTMAREPQTTRLATAPPHKK